MELFEASDGLGDVSFSRPNAKFYRCYSVGNEGDERFDLSELSISFHFLFDILQFFNIGELLFSSGDHRFNGRDLLLPANSTGILLEPNQFFDSGFQSGYP